MVQASTRAEKRHARLKERCALLADVVGSVGGLYHHESTTEDQKGYLETMIGAALWYLPVPKECWTGKMSIEAVRDYHPNSGIDEPKLTADHEYPRKIAAADLLMRWVDSDVDLKDEILALYVNKYGRFNYVTPRENRSLMRYQRRDTFVDPATAYARAKIKLVTVSHADLPAIKSRNASVIDRVMERFDG